MIGNKLIHVWNDYPANGDDLKRYSFARSTWLAEYDRSAWIECPVSDKDLKRNSKTVLGEVIPCPFIKDIFDIGCNAGEDSDILVYTNRDICLMPGIGKAIAKQLQSVAGLSCHRWDFHSDNLPEIHFDLMKGTWYCGCDLFAFKIGWWKKHRNEYPDMVSAREAFDWILRELIKLHGGAEWHTGIYHVAHSSYWYQPRVKNSNPAQLHNKHLARQFLTKHKLPQDGFSR